MKATDSLLKNALPAVSFFILAVVFCTVFYQAKLAAMCGFFAGHFMSNWSADAARARRTQPGNKSS